MLKWGGEAKLLTKTPFQRFCRGEYLLPPDVVVVRVQISSTDRRWR